MLFRSDKPHPLFPRFTVAESPELLAACALPLLREPAALRAMGARAAVLVRRFSWSRAVDVWEAALERAVRATSPNSLPPVGA